MVAVSSCRPVKWALLVADHLGVSAEYPSAVVSPELALVDPELAERARALLPSICAAVGTDSLTAEPFVHMRESLVARAAPARGRLTRFVTLAVLSAALVLGSELPNRGSASGNPATAVDSSSIAVPASSARVGSAIGHAQRTRSARNAPATTPAGTQQLRRLQLQQPTGATLSREPERDRRTATNVRRPFTLVWAAVATATSYDMELVRDETRIFAASSRSPRVSVPRSWVHGGVPYRLQPEDQVFVWPAVDGRRAERPTVNGTLALDLTPIARFISMNRRPHQP